MFDEACMNAFLKIKKRLVSTPIITALDWTMSFEIMCDASEHVVRVVLGQRHKKIFKAI